MSGSASVLTRAAALVTLLGALAVVCVIGVAIIAAQPPSAPPQVPDAFRSRGTLVPVDVRVVDRNGKPI